MSDQNTLSQKIDFAVIFKVKNANPNGDPLSGNRPRVTLDGYGEITDVCLKRKIRDRLMEEKDENGEYKYKVFVQSDEKKVDDKKSLHERAGDIVKQKNPSEIIKLACDEWIDVRAFGQVFAFKNKKESRESEESGLSVPIRGPVSIQSAFSLDKVNTTSTQITKSVNNETTDNEKKGSDTMGMKHRIDYGVYVFFGSILPQLAERTGFSDNDANVIKSVLPKIFENDASSSRPSGSMEVLKVIWWNHGCKSGKCSSAKVHNSLTVKNDGSYSLDEDVCRIFGEENIEQIDGF